jgi:hypothetical protein
MHRIRTIAVGAVLALALGACQGAVEGQTGAPSIAVPSNIPTALPSGLESAIPSGALDQLFPVFQAQGGSNITGGGILSDVDEGASVILGVVAPGQVDATFPAAIVEGDCASQTGQGPTPEGGAAGSPAASGAASSPAAASPEAASPEASGAASPAGSAEASGSVAPATEFPLWLTPISAGTSNTVIGVPTADLTASPHAIVVEASETDPTIVACADLQEGPPTMSSPAPASSPAGGSSPEASGSPEASPASS